MSRTVALYPTHEIITEHLSNKKYFNLPRGKASFLHASMPSDRSTQPRSPLAKKHSATSQSWAGMRRPSWIRGQTDGREDAPTVIATLFAPSRFSRIVILQTVFDTVVPAICRRDKRHYTYKVNILHSCTQLQFTLAIISIMYILFSRIIKH